MSSVEGWAPLKGLTILDFSMLLPGPLTTMILGDLGAEIIKVEPPGGDYARHMKGPMFQSANHGKKSICLDMKSSDAGSVIAALAKKADIAIEGFRPGVAARLGFGPAQLQAINPGLVYCSVSGFGQTGPAATKAGHDLAYLAMGGALWTKGQLRKSPSRASLPIADIAGGAFAAVSILAALRENKGAVLDISLYEATLYCAALRYGFETGAESVDHLYPANDLFETEDGRQIALTVIEEKFWDNLVGAVGDDFPAIRDAAYATETDRAKNYEGLMGLLDDMFLTRPAQDWIDYFDPLDVPAAICVSVQENMHTSHATARGLFRQSAAGPVFPFPVIASKQKTAVHGPSPDKGADADAILADLGYDKAAIQALVDRGVLVRNKG